MTVAKYEAHFYEVAGYATSILETRCERVRCFIEGLIPPIRMATQSLVVAGRTFAEVSDHTSVIEKMHRESREGHDKRPRF